MAVSNCGTPRMRKSGVRGSEMKTLGESLQRDNKRLRAKLAEAEWLVRELNKHEGAEGWSQYLNQRLDEYKFETKGDDDAR